MAQNPKNKPKQNQNSNSGQESPRTADQDQPKTAQPDETASANPEAVTKAGSTSETAAQLEEMKSRLQRVAADYQNYQRRTLAQIEQARQFARENLIKSLLPVTDNFRHTLEKGRETDDMQALLDGVKIVYDHLMDVLKNAGLEPIEIVPGENFDPAIHEAMLHEETEQFSPNTIVRELARGYTMNGRTLVPAKVSVAKAPAHSADEEQADNAAPTRQKDEPDAEYVDPE